MPAKAPTKMLNDPYDWIQKQSGLKTSNDVEVPERLIDQVIGQDQAVAVAEKAAAQKRNLLLIGDPGTGKSMIAKALKEMLPANQLHDILAYHNPEDPNNPKVLEAEPGEGKKIVKRMRRLARRKRLVKRIIEWSLIAGLVILGFVSMVLLSFEPTSILIFLIAVMAAGFLFQIFRQGADATMKTVPKILEEYDPKVANHTRYVDATGAHAGALLGDVLHDPFQSGGLETPTHQRVEIGAIHKAHKGILFVDEINVLRLDSQQALLTAMQDGKYSIVGQSEMSSGAMVKTAPVPCDFILVAAGNLDAVAPPDGMHTGMHPALRSRIRGYGYEVFVNDTMPDDHENRLKMCRFVAQEVKNDGRISAFDQEAMAEIILEGQRRSGRRGKLTLRLRELGGLVRTAGDVASSRGNKIVTGDDVREAKRLSRSLEQQITDQDLEERRTQERVEAGDDLIGMVPGAGLVGTGEVGEPAGLIIPISSAVTSPISRGGGAIAYEGGLNGSATSQTEIVSAILKRVAGDEVSSRDVHVQSVIAQDGVNAQASGLAMAISALSALEGVGVRQDTAVIGGLTVTGHVRTVKGITQMIETAVDAGYDRVIVPAASRDEILLNALYKARVELVFKSDLTEVVEDMMRGTGKKRIMTALTAKPRKR